MKINKLMVGSALERFCVCLLGLEVLLAPLPLASMNRFSLGFVVLLGGLIFVTLNISLMLQDKHLSTEDLVNPPLILLYLYTALLFFQSKVTYFAGASHWLPVSTDAYSTKIQLLFTLGLIFNFISLSYLCAKWERVKMLLGVVVVLGAYQACLGMYLYGIEASYQFIYFPVNHGNRMLGTYGNPNHFAGLMEICLSVTLGLMLTYFTTKTVRKSLTSTKLSVYFFDILSPKFLLRLLVVLLFVALLLSESRMGNAGFMAALIITLMLGAILMKNWQKKIFILLLSIIVVDAFLVGQMIGVQKVVTRIQETSVSKESRMSQESLEERLLPSSNGIDIVKERPVFGFGAGAFYATYGHFYSPEKYGYFEHAHNDYVEVLIETGWVGLMLLGSLALILLGISAKLMAEESVKSRGIGVIGLMMTTAMLIHSGVDFNFHITANILIYMFIYAICWTFYKKCVK